MGAIFILLAVGALIGTWNMAGTIPTIVDYGSGPRPELVLSLVVIICAITGSITGSSWTTAGTSASRSWGLRKSWDSRRRSRRAR